MNIKGILKDSLRYPFSDWKKILIFGIIILISNLSNTTHFNSLISTTDVTLTFFLGIISFLILFLAKGYQFKIMKSSLTRKAKPPEFNKWIEMFKDGVKLFLVNIVYTIPAILIMLIWAALSIASNPSTVVNTISGLGTLFLMGGTGSNAFITSAGIWFIISFLYTIIIAPIMWMAIAHMADNNSEIHAAFKFHAILNKITTIKWKNLIKWYILTGIIFLIIDIIIRLILLALLSLIIPITELEAVKIAETILLNSVIIPLIVLPYLYMYLYRSVALIYLSE
jgi:hypothetical protein